MSGASWSQHKTAAENQSRTAADSMLWDKLACQTAVVNASFERHLLWHPISAMDKPGQSSMAWHKLRNHRIKQLPSLLALAMLETWKVKLHGVD
jgi:hypothetical protein